MSHTISSLRVNATHNSGVARRTGHRNSRAIFEESEFNDIVS
jgi:hypothetical protein